MAPRQSFGVAVRTVGLIILIYGLYSGLHTAIELIGVHTRIHEPYAAGAILFRALPITHHGRDRDSS